MNDKNPVVILLSFLSIIFMTVSPLSRAQNLLLKEVGQSAISASSGFVGDYLLWAGSLWDLTDGSRRIALPSPAGIVAFSHDQHFIVGSAEGFTESAQAPDQLRLAVSDLKTGKNIRDIPYVRPAQLPMQALQFHGVQHFQLSGDDRRLIVQWKTVQIWDVTSAKNLFELPQGQASFSPALQAILLIRPGQAIVYRYADGTKLCEVPLSIGRFSTTGVFSPDGSRFLTVNNGVLNIWNTDDCGNSLSLKITDTYFTQAAFVNGGKEIAINSGIPAQIEIRNAASGQIVRSIRQPGARTIHDFCLNPDGSRLLISWLAPGSHSNTETSLWNVSTGSELRRFGGLGTSTLDSRSVTAGFSPRSNWVVLVRLRDGGPSSLWDADTGEFISSFQSQR